ncbi:MAG: galactokinase [Anaerolineaceae bacterium]|nr:MAG: galactokinase [Anaerolineaceae bacterium]
MLTRVQVAFHSIFRSPPAFIVRAPGRVNLIGEHTDYNEGFVLPMAIDRAVWIALRPRTDRRVLVHSLDLNLSAAFDLDSLTRGKNRWEEYIKGVAHELQLAHYHLTGWEGILTGDVPRGAGLSSSAALEVATARAFASVSGFEWDALRIARIGQRAENNWLEVQTGIMDQSVSAGAKAGHAFFLDCRSLEYQHIPLPKDIAVVVMDTSTRRGLVDSAYNARRSQCERAAKFFGVKALRDVGVEKIEEEKNKTKNVKGAWLDDVALKRARHVVTENARVLKAVEAMRLNDAVTLGRLFNESHVSLRDDFEVTNDALNWIVEAAQARSECLGARMTGAGFGGCAVALVPKDSAEAFAKAVGAEYRARSGKETAIFVSEAGEGASVV